MLPTYCYCSLVHAIFAYFSPSEQFLDVSSGTINHMSVHTYEKPFPFNIVPYLAMKIWTIILVIYQIIHISI